MLIEIDVSDLGNLINACGGIWFDQTVEYKRKSTSKRDKEVLLQSMKWWKYMHDYLEAQLFEYEESMKRRKNNEV